ncbi:unnamed protein product [Allacma fusca]|uniref:39S ribosomal protein L13, mitochondrial n=1 Tax=Allacma fusca TaxID=39272 RepID=A0A8J2NRS8_9HEXA|nr:unnamed protein product [Allacma fusca]
MGSKRVQQWLTFSRSWWLFDAKWQDPYKAAPIIAKYLKGAHKPIHGGSHVDCGDHVVVINSKEIALRADEWFYRVYFHHTGYPGGATWTKAWELHKKDPTMIIQKAVYTKLGVNLNRRPNIARLHIYPDENVPEKIMQNVTDQIPGLRTVPKSIDDYTKEEIEKYPKLFDYPKDYALQ